MASGGNNISDINNDPPQEAYVLYGAVVGGPDKYDRYFDIRADWPETEVRWSWLVRCPMFIYFPARPGLQRAYVDPCRYARPQRYLGPILYIFASWYLRFQTPAGHAMRRSIPRGLRWPTTQSNRADRNGSHCWSCGCSYLLIGWVVGLASISWRLSSDILLVLCSSSQKNFALRACVKPLVWITSNSPWPPGWRAHQDRATEKQWMMQ